MSNNQDKIDPIATEINNVLSGKYTFSNFNVRKREYLKLIQLAENNPDVTLKDVLENLSDRLT